ncbi:MAG: InlB B-repeat-containing protein [Bifidobacteriaceae bacterium]|jgi:hypothetical protein|nr:InlB B-repeat-containing protein [Bifidobacteriaceae bacterium]MCI1979139.1 InlB B-repeat-containing protein [Bifidobacteriaceae bacterium]
MGRRTGKMRIILIIFSVLAAVVLSLFLPLSATAAELSNDSLSFRHASAALSAIPESRGRHGGWWYSGWHRSSENGDTADSSQKNPVLVFVSHEGSCISTDVIELKPGYSTAPAQPGCGPENGVFLGWSSHSGATQPDFPSGHIFTTVPSSRSFYAVWRVTPTTYTLLFDTNGGTQEVSSVKVAAPHFLATLPNEVIREGYRFLGWNTAADGTGISYGGGESIRVPRDATLYAQWEKIAVIPTPDADSDSGSNSEETTEKTDEEKGSGETESADAVHEERKDEQKETEGTKETDGKNPLTDTVRRSLFGNSRWKGTAVFPNVVFTIPSTEQGGTAHGDDSGSAPEGSHGGDDTDVSPEPDKSQDQRTESPWTKDSRTKNPRTVDPPFSDMSVEPDSLEEGEDVSQSAFARHAGPLLGVAAVLFVGVAAAFFPLSAGASAGAAGGAKVSLVRKLLHAFRRL